eukprot:TRINITY_DN15546_c0_g1_i1.p1 TRINITY_DN15546_c0_g1~~TRINITY_DN15546_c0_g1_i1.p1  ORF type:complete len:147 (-),score=46.75 TRINITY_DN15546_c0_g1_i1:141-581(-)
MSYYYGNRSGGSSSQHETVYTRGSCKSNGQPGAQATAQTYNPGKGYATSGPVYGSKQTNNRGEIQAARNAISSAKMSGASGVTIKSNSNYVPNAMNSHMGKWQSNGWKTSSGRPVQNQGDFRALSKAVQNSNMDVKFQHCGKGSNK